MTRLSMAFLKTTSKEYFRYQREALTLLLNALGLKDPSTKDHSLKVAEYALLIANELGFSNSQAQIMELSGLIHDVGKIAIPDEILNKPSKLTSDEFDLIRTHPNRGAEILKGLSGFDLLLPAVLYHHERFDGLGYPGLRKGTDIPLSARIISVADAFDAMTNHRSYRKKVSFNEALEELNINSGTQFDKDIVQALSSSIKKIQT